MLLLLLAALEVWGLNVLARELAPELVQVVVFLPLTGWHTTVVRTQQNLQ